MMDDLSELQDDIWDEEILQGIADEKWRDDMAANRRSESDVGLIKELQKRKNPETPDFHELKARGDNFVFVYGTLRPGGSNFPLVSSQKYLGEAVTLMENFILRDYKKFPIVKPCKDRLKGKIHGDVFAVDALTMLELDLLEGNGTFYTRKEVFVVLHDQTYSLASGKKANPMVKAWMYMIPESDTSFDDQWLGNSRNSVRTDGTAQRIYEWSGPPKSFVM